MSIHLSTLWSHQVGAKYGPRGPLRAIYEPGGQGVAETPIASKGLKQFSVAIFYFLLQNLNFSRPLCALFGSWIHPHPILSDYIPSHCITRKFITCLLPNSDSWLLGMRKWCNLFRLIRWMNVVISQKPCNISLENEHNVKKLTMWLVNIELYSN